MKIKKLNFFENVKIPSSKLSKVYGGTDSPTNIGGEGCDTECDNNGNGVLDCGDSIEINCD